MCLASDLSRVAAWCGVQSCRHLDNVHSIFGRVVGGAQTTLARMEEVETDKVRSTRLLPLDFPLSLVDRSEVCVWAAAERQAGAGDQDHQGCGLRSQPRGGGGEGLR